MKDKVGYQIGLSSQLPLNESGILGMIVSALDWQDSKGPTIIFVDEGFYRFLLRSRIEIIYHDILPIPNDSTLEEAHNIANGVFPVEIFPIENTLEANLSREEINAYIESIPEEIRDGWPEMLMNEEMILSLSQSNSK